MLKIKCEHGHPVRMGTVEWLDTLTLDQLRFARDTAADKIKAAEEQPKRIVWRVCRGAICVGNYREEDHEKTADHFLRIFKETFMEEAAEYVAKPNGTETFRRQLPSIEVERCTQFEYDTEWFPTKTE